MQDVGHYASRFTFFCFLLINVALIFVSCTKTTPPPKVPPSKPSDIKVDVKDGGEIRPGNLREHIRLKGVTIDLLPVPA